MAYQKTFSSYTPEAQAYALRQAERKAQGKYISQYEQPEEFRQAYARLLQENPSISRAVQAGSAAKIAATESGFKNVQEFMNVRKPVEAQVRQRLVTEFQQAKDYVQEVLNRPKTAEINAQLTQQQVQDKFPVTQPTQNRFQQFLNRPETIRSIIPRQIPVPSSIANIQIKGLKEAVSNKLTNPYAKVGLMFIPETRGEKYLAAGTLVGGALATPAILYGTSALFTGIALGQRQAATTPEERAAANINLALGVLPFALKGVNYAFREPVATPVRKGQTVEYRMKTADGQDVVLKRPFNPNERLTFEAGVVPKQVGDNMFSIGKIKIRQFIPETYEMVSGSRFGKLFFEPTQRVLSRAKYTEVISKEPIIIDQNGNLLKPVKFEAYKPKTSYQGRSKFFNYAKLDSATTKLPLSKIKEFPPELQQQILRAYEMQTGRFMSADTFAKVFANSKAEFAISSVEARRLGRISVGKDEVAVRFPKAGTKTTRTELFDESKLLLGGDALPFEIYGTKTSFRDVTLPEVVGRAKQPRRMTGKTVVFKPKPEPTGLTFEDTVVKRPTPTGDVLEVVRTIKQKQPPKQLPTKEVVKKFDLIRTNIAENLLPQRQARITPRAAVKRNVARTSGVAGVTTILTGSASALQPRQSPSQVTPTASANLELTRTLTRELTREQTRLQTFELTRADTAQQQRQSQAVTTLLVQRPVTQLTTITQTTSRPRAISRPTFPLALPFIKRSQPVRRIKQVKKRKAQRQFEITPTVRNVLTGQRRRTPIKLSQLTGFESLTI